MWREKSIEAYPKNPLYKNGKKIIIVKKTLL